MNIIYFITNNIYLSKPKKISFFKRSTFIEVFSNGELKNVKISLMTITKTLVTQEPFKLHNNVAPFWNPENQSKLLISVTNL